MVYRTRTYIAADWDGDRDAVDQLHKWNDSDYWGAFIYGCPQFTAVARFQPALQHKELAERENGSFQTFRAYRGGFDGHRD